MKRIVLEILVAALIVYFVTFSIFVITDRNIIEQKQVKENKCENAIDYKDIKSKVESVSPSKRYVILSLCWQDDSWPVSYYLQEMKSKKLYEFPQGSVDLIGIDIPSIYSWSPKEDVLLIVFKPGKAPEYVREFKISKNGIAIGRSMPPPGEPGEQYNSEFIWSVKNINWQNNNKAVINASTVTKKYIQTSMATQVKTRTGLTRFTYDGNSGFGGHGSGLWIYNFYKLIRGN